MSEEEKEAINNLNFIIVTDVYDNEVKIDKTKIVNEYNESVGIVLNLISNLQKENEELHKEINQRIKLKLENEKIADELYNKIKNLQKELEYKDDIIHDLGTEVLPISIEGFEVLLNKTKEENDNLQKELDKKDKVIDELIMLLLEFDIDEIYCAKIKDCFEVADGKCSDCIKQYFYKKAEGKDE